MRAKKVEKIELSPEDKQKRVDEIMKKNIQMIKRQRPVTIEPTTDEDCETVAIKNKAMFYQVQKGFRATYLGLCVIHEELKEMQKHIDGYMKLYDEKKKESKYMIPMLWEGMEYPINILKTFYNLKQNTYANSIASMNETRYQLIHVYGLTDQQCDEILLTGVYIRDLPKKELPEEEVKEMKL